MVPDVSNKGNASNLNCPACKIVITFRGNMSRHLKNAHGMNDEKKRKVVTQVLFSELNTKKSKKFICTKCHVVRARKNIHANESPECEEYVISVTNYEDLPMMYKMELKSTENNDQNSDVWKKLTTIYCRQSQESNPGPL